MSQDPVAGAGPVRRLAWETMSEAMRGVATTLPSITRVAKQAVAIHGRKPDFIRVDQGQVVGVDPEREVYYGPPAGLADLRRLVGRFWTIAYGLEGLEGIPEGGLGPEHVSIVSGGTEGVAILMRILAPGRRVALPRLHWGNYRGLISLAGGEIVLIDYFRPDGSFDLDGIRAAVEKEDVRILVLNFPNNPTGDTLYDDELEAIAALARERDLILISDEVYNWMRYDDQPRSMFAFAPERTIVTGAASKEYLVPGARTGYVLTTDETFSDVWFPRITRATSSSPNVLGQRLVIGPLGEDVEDMEAGRPPRHLSALKAELRLRRDRMAEAAREAGFRIATRHDDLPLGGISMLGSLPEGLEDDVAYLERAMETERFSAIPGAAFGAPGTVRLGYAGVPLESMEALGRHMRDLAEEMLAEGESSA